MRISLLGSRVDRAAVSGRRECEISTAIMFDGTIRHDLALLEFPLVDCHSLHDFVMPWTQIIATSSITRSWYLTTQSEGRARLAANNYYMIRDPFPPNSPTPLTSSYSTSRNPHNHSTSPLEHSNAHSSSPRSPPLAPDSNETNDPRAWFPRGRPPKYPADDR